MYSCDQSLVTLAFQWEKLPQSQFFKDLNRQNANLEWLSWLKFDNLGLALGTNLKFYTSVAKGLKLKERKFWELIPMFLEITEENRGKTGRGSTPLNDAILTNIYIFIIFIAIWFYSTLLPFKNFLMQYKIM